jgi:hypothetical protein
MKQIVIILRNLALIAGGCGEKKKKQESVTETEQSATETDGFVHVSDSLKINKSLTYWFNAKIVVLDSITDPSLLANIYDGIGANDYSRNGLQKAILKLKEVHFAKTLELYDDWDETDDFDRVLDDNIEISVSSKEDNFMTIVYYSSGYTGGVHGYYSYTYKTFDLKNNKPVLLENIIKNVEDETWSKILKEKFLAGEGEDGEDMLFSIDDIPLTDNFYFGKTGITFVYNTYEIAPYAAGLIHIEIPFSSEIEKMLEPDFLKLVKGS